MIRKFDRRQICSDSTRAKSSSVCWRWFSTLRALTAREVSGSGKPAATKDLSTQGACFFASSSFLPRRVLPIKYLFLDQLAPMALARRAASLPFVSHVKNDSSLTMVRPLAGISSAGVWCLGSQVLSLVPVFLAMGCLFSLPWSCTPGFGRLACSIRSRGSLSARLRQLGLRVNLVAPDGTRRATRAPVLYKLSRIR